MDLAPGNVAATGRSNSAERGLWLSLRLAQGLQVLKIAPHCIYTAYHVQVGKTSLIKGLVKHYTKQNLADPLGPITLVTGE